MTRIQPFVRIIALLALVASAASASAQGVTLRYRWTKGETVTYRMTMLTASAATGMPGVAEMKVDQTMTQVVTMMVEDVASDGATTLRQTFVSVKMEMNGPIGHVAYDTAAPRANANPIVQSIRQVLDGMVGESVTVVQAPDGAVRKVEGASRILDKIVKSMPDGPSSQAASQGLRSLLSDEALKTTMEQSFSKFPQHPVKPGDTWDGQMSVGNEASGRIGGTVTFTLKSLEGSPDAGVARIAVGLRLKQEIAAPPGPNGMTLKLGEVRGEGELLFDAASGRVRKSTMKTDMPSTISGAGPDGNPVAMQNRTTTTVTMELVEK